MKTRLIAGLASLALCAGCSTAITHDKLNCSNSTGTYRGVRFDTTLLTHPEQIPTNSAAPRVKTICFSVLDLPFSAVADTVLLPVDLTYHTTKAAEDKNTNQPPNTPH